MRCLLLVALLIVGGAAALHADVIGHWKLDESPGETTAADSGGDHPGTLHGDAAFETGGVAGNCVHVTTGGNGFVEMGDHFRFVSGDFAIVAWAKTAAGDKTSDYIIAGKHRARITAGYMVGINANGPYGTIDKAWFYQSNRPGQEVISTSDVNDGSWHQIAIVYRASRKARMYVDGAPLEASSPAIGIGGNDAPFGIAVVDFNGAPKGFFTGWVDDVQLYPHHLNDVQVQYLFNHPGESVIGALGDLNCDDAVDFNDIDPFVLALVDPEAYGAAYPDCEIRHADMNYDGAVDFNDIDGFVAVLVE